MHHRQRTHPSRSLLALVAASVLGLGLAGVGVVGNSPAIGAVSHRAGVEARTTPVKILSVAYTPDALIFNDDSPLHLTAVVRVQVNRATNPTYSASTALSGIADPSCSIFASSCPLLLTTETVTSNQDVDIFTMSGTIPNVLADGTLSRSNGTPPRRFRPTVVYATSTGSTSSISGGNELVVVGDQRVRIDAPNSIPSGSSLTVRAVSEQFNRAWVPSPGPLQLAFQSNGTGPFNPIGAAQQTGQDGVATFTVPSVGSPGNWHVTTTAPPGGRTIVSNEVHVGFDQTPPPTPSAPIVTFNKATTGSLFFNITAPAVGAPIDHYEWSWTPADGGGSATSQPGTSPFEITGLSPGTHYDVTVRAVNGQGPGEPANASGTTEVVPPSIDVPGVPRKVHGKAGNHKAVVKWKAPATTGGAPVTKYVVHRFKQNKKVDGSARSVTFSGLANNKTYTFFVKACNKAGCGGFSKGVALRPHR